MEHLRWLSDCNEWRVKELRDWLMKEKWKKEERENETKNEVEGWNIYSHRKNIYSYSLPPDVSVFVRPVVQ